MSLPLYPFDGDLCIGTVTEVGPAYPRGNLPQASLPEAQWHHGHRQGRVEVDDFVLIEISGAAIFGRIVNIRLAEKERLTVEPSLGDRKILTRSAPFSFFQPSLWSLVLFRGELLTTRDLGAGSTQHILES